MLTKKRTIVLLTCILFTVPAVLFVLFGTNYGVSNAQGVSLKLQMYNGVRTDKTNTLYPRFKLTNTGSENIDLSAVKIKYYYSAEGEQEQSFWCDWCSKGNSIASGAFTRLSGNDSTAANTLEISFANNAGQLAAGESMELHTRIAKNDWSDFSQNNDYSYCSSASDYVDWNKAILTFAGGRVWGEEPQIVDSPATEPSDGPSVTPTPTPEPVNTPTPVADAPAALKLQMYNSNTNETSNTIFPRFKLLNNGPSAVDLENVKIRYYFTADDEKEQKFICDWSEAGSSNISGKIDKMPTAMVGADRYLEIGFTAGAGSLKTGESIEIHCRIYQSDWSDYNQADDFSFNGLDKGYQDWSKATVYEANTKVWGNEPNIPAPIVPLVRALQLKLCNTQTMDKSNTLFIRYLLTNTGNVTVDLNKARLRYFYTVDGETDQYVWCDWSSAGSGNITGKFIKLPDAFDKADYYLETGFTSGAGMLKPGKSVEIHLRVAKKDWLDYLQGNDYSYAGTGNDYIQWDRVAVLIDDELVSGDSTILGTTKNITMQPSETSAALKWIRVEGATGYDIECNGQIIGSAEKEEYIATELCAGTDYTFRIRAKTSTVIGKWSMEFKTLTLPKAPVITTKNAGNNNIRFEWVNSQSADYYDIEADGTLIEKAVNPYMQEGLIQGTVHEYRIRAHNSSGWGNWSEPFAIWTLPCDVENVDFFATKDVIALAWDWSQGAASYEVEFDGRIYEEVTGAYSALDLLSGTEHTVRVRAKNDSGVGQWSNSLTIWTLPGEVTSMAGEATTNEIKYRWDAVTGAVGYDADIDGVLVENVQSPYSVVGLSAGTRHMVSIRAKNSSGIGAWSKSFEVWSLPDVVSSIDLNPKETEIIAQWSEVEGATGYDLDINGTVMENIQQPYICSGLLSGTDYIFKIRARNSSGAGAWSAPGLTRTIPGMVDHSMEQAFVDKLVIIWDNVRGADIYDIEIDGILQENVQTPYINSGLLAGTEHTYRLRAANASGSGEWSDEKVAWTLPEVPQDILQTATDTTITTYWKPAQGATGYDIEADGLLVPNAENPYVNNELFPGTQHTYRVRAKNSSGDGAWSKLFTKMTLPGRVAGIKASATQTEINISWESALGADGYDLSADGVVINNIESPYSFVNLDPGTKHIFSIRARNSSGDGNWNEEFEVWTLPGIPTSIQISAGDSSIHIGWEPVEGATGYDVEVLNNVVDTGGSNAYLHSGLAPNTQYSYRIRAKNSSGYGSWSKIVADTTLPGVPSEVHVSSTNEEIRLEWKPVAGASGYEVEADGEVIASVDHPDFQHIGLLPGTVHGYRVRTINNQGVSEWSNETKAFTLLSAAENMTVQYVEDSIKITWDAVEGAERYEIDVDGKVQSCGSELYFLHENAEAVSEHRYRVRAVNNDTTGVWNDYSVISSPLDMVNNIQVKEQNREIQLSWDMVSGASGYEVEADGEILDNGKGNTFVHTGLLPDSLHQYKVRAKSSTNVGVWSDPVTGYTLPKIPENITIVPHDRRITIGWDEVPEAVGYELMVDGQIVKVGSECTYVQSDLEPDTQHFYKIRAKGKNRYSQWSEGYIASTLAGIPSNIRLHAQSSAITIEWDEAAGADSYEIEADGEIIPGISGLTFRIDKLEPESEHDYRVRSRNNLGAGEWSEFFKIKTSTAVPEHFTAVSTTTEITLSWDSVGGAVGYELEIDGVDIKELNETSYIHTKLQANTKHTYRIRSKSGDQVSEWSSTLSQSTVPEMVIPLKKDNTFNFVIVASAKDTVAETTIIVRYNADELEVFDLCAATAQPETAAGKITGTNITVTEVKPGRIVYKITAAGKTVVNTIKFISKKGGNSKVTYTIE